MKQKLKELLLFMKPYAIEDRKILLKDDVFDEKIKNMSLEEIKNGLIALDEGGYIKIKIFLNDTVMVMEVLQKGLELMDCNFSEEEEETEFILPWKRKDFKAPDNFTSNNTNQILNKDISATGTEVSSPKKNEGKSTLEYSNIKRDDSSDKTSPADYNNKHTKNTGNNFSEKYDSSMDISSYYINRKTDYLDVKKMIFSDDRISEDDQKTLLSLIVLIETMTENNVPLPKGAFSKYEDVITKYKWISDVIGRVLVNMYFI